MNSKFNKIFILDDRTGKFSTTKLIRWLSFAVTTLSIISLQCMIYFNWVEISVNDISLLNIVERLLMALSGSAEMAYQFNRNNKMKNGVLEVNKERSEDEVEREDI